MHTVHNKLMFDAIEIPIYKRNDTVSVLVCRGAEERESVWYVCVCVNIFALILCNLFTVVTFFVVYDRFFFWHVERAAPQNYDEEVLVIFIRTYGACVRDALPCHLYLATSLYLIPFRSHSCDSKEFRYSR